MKGDFTLWENNEDRQDIAGKSVSGLHPSSFLLNDALSSSQTLCL